MQIAGIVERRAVQAAQVKFFVEEDEFIAAIVAATEFAATLPPGEPVAGFVFQSNWIVTGCRTAWFAGGAEQASNNPQIIRAAVRSACAARQETTHFFTFALLEKMHEIPPIAIVAWSIWYDPRA